MGRLRSLAFLGGVAIMAAVALASPPAHAGDPQVLASSCSGCHTSTDSLTTAIPRIRGLPKIVFTQAMEGFRTGKRSATVMDRIAKGLTEDEIEQLAAYFNARK
jgi:cytochrome subunit of sulfide dehydrogenase